MNWKKQTRQGFILLEAIIMIGILGILFASLMPSYAQGLEKTRESVCKKNCWNLEKLYEVDLVIQNKKHSERAFKAFLIEQSGVCCPDKGMIKYVNGLVTCTIHDEANEEKGHDNGTGIPIL